MPELPEVETIARQLAPLILGQRVRRLEVFDAKLGLANPEAAAGRTIRGVRRIGKQVVIDLRRRPAAGPLWLCIHLRMTGRLIWSRELEPAERSLRARLTLDEGYLVFNDVRRFGTMRLLGALDALHPGGLDPLDERFTPAGLTALLSGARGAIKPWLLRQDKLAGLGNIYAAEALFGARIDPRRPGATLGAAEIGRLHRAIRHVLRQGIEFGGTSFSDFQNARGERGAFQERLAVYGRAGQPCKQCGGAIERLVQQGRATFHCPRCQANTGGREA